MRSLQNAGGAGVSTRTLGTVANETLLSLAALAWVCPLGRGGRKLFTIIDVGQGREVSMFQSLSDRGLGKRGHDFVSRGIGVQAVLG